ncbi:cell division topological specificity factor MinE [Selenomonadales bacterium OttesenSCG-928-I06]|nr:cell division topological specificity factor MinE [Selenomonadales bacterium OttesenSCG-928-I06]
MFSSLLNRLFGSGQGSKDVAKDRLKAALVSDRVNIQPFYMETIKDDIIKVISNYMEVNVGQSQVILTKNQSMIALTANIPVTRVKRSGLLEEPEGF